VSPQNRYLVPAFGTIKAVKEHPRGLRSDTLALRDRGAEDVPTPVSFGGLGNRGRGYSSNPPLYALSASPLSHAERPCGLAFLRYPTFSCGVQRNSTRAVAGFLSGGLPLGRLGLSMPNSSPYKYLLQSLLTYG
jgi:hypothetical protein